MGIRKKYYVEGEIPGHMLASLRLSELNPNAVVIKHLDNALIGMAMVPGQPPVALYDRSIAIRELMRVNKITEPVATEAIDKECCMDWDGEAPIFAEVWK